MISFGQNTGLFYCFYNFVLPGVRPREGESCETGGATICLATLICKGDGIMAFDLLKWTD